MNRVMKAKNDKRKQEEMKAKKERFCMVASHRYYAETLPESSSYFFARDVIASTKMWWEV